MADDVSPAMDASVSQDEVLQEIVRIPAILKVVCLNHSVGRYVMRGGNHTLAVSTTTEEPQEAYKQHQPNPVLIHGPEV